MALAHAKEIKPSFKHVYHNDQTRDLIIAVFKGDKLHVEKLLQAFNFGDKTLEIAKKESGEKNRGRCVLDVL